MNVSEKTLEELIQKLPNDKVGEVRDFIEFILSKSTMKPRQKLLQNWAGALRDFKEQYTSLELQQKSVAWRGD